MFVYKVNYFVTLAIKTVIYKSKLLVYLWLRKPRIWALYFKSLLYGRTL